MKKLKKVHIAILLSMAAILILPFCSRHNQTGNLTTGVLNTDTLYAVKGTAGLQPIGGSAWDGNIEAVWNNAPKLTVHAVVPDLGNGTFDGFIGNATDITMRSLYDAGNIYFLVEFNTGQKNVKSSPWYFDPAAKQWAREDIAPTLNADGTYRPAFVQDRFLMMFNIANSCKTFNTLSCYAACHKNSSFDGMTATGGTMHSNGPNERLDIWMPSMVQVLNENQGEDNFIDDGSSDGNSGILNNTEVHSDMQVNSDDGGFDNTQTLTTLITGTEVEVPMWLMPGGNYMNGAIMIKETLSGGAAVMVTAVDSNGVLTLANGTKIDPRTGTDYKRVGACTGPKCIPGSIVAPYTGSHGDITANAFYTGSGWRLLLKRALKTSDTVNDADFSSLSDQPFGVAAMFNGADNEHAIVAGLTLRFNK